MKAGSYLRVSRADQSVALQSDEVQRLVALRGWQLAEQFVDEGFSGANDKRPAYHRMMDAARRRRIDVVVVYRSDRLFRSVHEFICALHELQSYNVAFVSVTEPFDTLSASGRLMQTMVAAFAEFERDVMIQRTHSGLAAARARGVRLGRPPANLDAEKIKELREKGAAWRDIARQMGCSVSTVHSVLGKKRVG